MMKALMSKFKALHRDQQGATMIEYALVFAAVALPLLAVLIFFWKDIAKWAGQLWESAKEAEGTDPDTL